MPRLDELRASGETLTNLDTGERFDSFGMPALTANAYLGGRGITAALAAGADVVITGRVTDAALVVGPAAWWHGWSYDDPANLDRLAGAVVAGHVIECGAQATGGNYSFFTDVPGLEHVGFPWAEVADDGSSVIGKHEGTGGLVSVGTVTAQLLYEIGRTGVRQPGRHGALRLDPARAGRASTAVRVWACAARPRPRRSRSPLNHARRLPQRRVPRAHRTRRRGEGRPRAADDRRRVSRSSPLRVARGPRSGLDVRRARAARRAAAPRPRRPRNDGRRAGRAADRREVLRPEGCRQGVHRADRGERPRHLPRHVPDRAACRGDAVRRLLADHASPRSSSRRP